MVRTAMTTRMTTAVSIAWCFMMCGHATHAQTTGLTSAIPVVGSGLAPSPSPAVQEYKLDVLGQFANGLRVQTDTVGGNVASFGGLGNFRIDAPFSPGGRFAVREDGKVGIGTDNPAEKLSVAGTVQSTSGGFRFPDGSVQQTAAANGNAIQNSTTLQTGANFNIDGNGQLGGALGIGTVPAYKVHLVDSSNTGLRVQTNTPGGTVASFGGAGAFLVDAPGVAGGRLAVTEAGNVGIGTASPATKLSVAGTVQSTSGGFKFPDNSVQTTAATGAVNTTYTTSALAQGPELPVPGSGFTNILHLNLPAGSYLLLGSVEFYNQANFFNSDNTRDLGCRFSTDTNDMFGFTSKIPGLASGLLTVHSVTTISSGGVDLQCKIINGNGSSVTPQTRRLTAVQIPSVVVQ